MTILCVNSLKFCQVTFRLLWLDIFRHWCFFTNSDGKFWRLFVILTERNSHLCPVGGGCVKFRSCWLEMPVFCVAADCGFSLQNKVKVIHSLSERKTQNLMTFASAEITLDVFDYAQASAQFKSIRTRRKVWVQARLQQVSSVTGNSVSVFLSVVCSWFKCNGLIL